MVNGSVSNVYHLILEWVLAALVTILINRVHKLTITMLLAVLLAGK